MRVRLGRCLCLSLCRRRDICHSFYSLLGFIFLLQIRDDSRLHRFEAVEEIRICRQLRVVNDRKHCKRTHEVVRDVCPLRNSLTFLLHVLQKRLQTACERPRLRIVGGKLVLVEVCKQLTSHTHNEASITLHDKHRIGMFQYRLRDSCACKLERIVGNKTLEVAVRLTVLAVPVDASVRANDVDENELIEKVINNDIEKHLP